MVVVVLLLLLAALLGGRIGELRLEDGPEDPAGCGDAMAKTSRKAEIPRRNRMPDRTERVCPRI